MSKHTTIPRKVYQSEISYDHGIRSNVLDGNRNKHKKRSVDSHLRTSGRIARYIRRNAGLAST